MALSITATDVANRLLRSVSDINSDYLESSGMITYSVAYVNQLLTNNSIDYDEQEDDYKAIAKGMAIIHCARSVLNEPPENWKVGPVTEGLKSTIKTLIDSLENQFQEGCDILELVLHTASFSTITTKVN